MTTEPTVEETHPTPDPAVPADDNVAAKPADEVVDNADGTGHFDLPTEVWGNIGLLHHVVADDRTTVCGRQLDSDSVTIRLAAPPQGLLCGICLGRLIGP